MPAYGHIAKNEIPKIEALLKDLEQLRLCAILSHPIGLFQKFRGTMDRLRHNEVFKLSTDDGVNLEFEYTRSAGWSLLLELPDGDYSMFVHAELADDCVRAAIHDLQQCLVDSARPCPRVAATAAP